MEYTNNILEYTNNILEYTNMLSLRILSDAFDSSGTVLPYCESVAMATTPDPHPVLHTWSDHSLPVTAVYCGGGGGGGGRGRVVTASLDQTCKVSE